MTAPAGPTTTETAPAATVPASPQPGPQPTYAAPATQADLDRIVESRLSRERAKFADYDELKAKAEAHDAAEAELASEGDKKAKEARKSAIDESDAKYRPMLAKTAFQVAIGDRKPPAEVEDFLADLNLTRFLKDDGTVDTAKVLARVEQFAPAKGTQQAPPPRGPVIPGHSAGGQQISKPGDQGRAMAERRFGKKP